ncbi:hypothetical protein DFH09DRAFT_1178408 [Mycena vulgaris]|nr:hypothetical protein DFH09DRAFT_1178408 [Mycena vulgaris]
MAADATVDVTLSFGPMLVGIFFNMILFGVLLSQQLTYFQSGQKDPLLIRILAWYIFFVEIANTALDISIIYEPLILHYGAMPNLLPTVFIAQPLSVILVDWPIQIFFIWRIRTLTQNNWIPAGIFLVSLVAFGGGLWTTILIPVTRTYARIPPVLDLSSEVWFIATAATDLSIAVVMSLCLRRMKTGFAGTDTVIDKIIRATVQTGMLTAFFALLEIFCFLTFKRTTLNFIWDFPLSKLYSNCLISSLNARRSWNQNMKHNLPSSGLSQNISLSVPVFGSGQSDTIRGEDEYGIRMTKVIERV